MKKLLSILGLVTVIGIGSFAYASASDGVAENSKSTDYQTRPNYEDRIETRSDYDGRIENRHEHMREYRREDLDRSLRDGEISQEEAKKWEEHYNYMDEFHNENGYRGCHGEGNTRRHGGRRGMGRGSRY